MIGIIWFGGCIATFVGAIIFDTWANGWRMSIGWLVSCLLLAAVWPLSLLVAIVVGLKMRTK